MARGSIIWQTIGGNPLAKEGSQGRQAIGDGGSKKRRLTLGTCVVWPREKVSRNVLFEVPMPSLVRISKRAQESESFAGWP